MVPESIIRLDTPAGITAYHPSYKVPETLKPILQEQIDKWLSDSIITRAPVNTAWNSPLTFTPKKDIDSNFTKYRPCLDPRHINRLLSDDRFPLP